MSSRNSPLIFTVCAFGSFVASDSIQILSRAPWPADVAFRCKTKSRGSIRPRNEVRVSDSSLVNQQQGISRRHAIRLGAAGFAAAAGARAFATEGNAMTSGKLEDPKTKYPKPPFKEQQQPWPGLASKMEPRPDHGEKSYKGSGRLLGRKALITGGDSGMGRGAAIAYAREGADVAINYFPTEQPDADEVIALIKEAGRKAVAIPGDLREENFCKKLVSDAIQQLGGLDILVCNAARQQTRKSILDITTEDFDATMKTNIYAPF